MEIFILNRTKKELTYPDYHLEEFWLSFKNSIINYCKYIGKSLLDFEKTIILYSDNLNKLQNEKKYDEIETNIYIFLIKYALLLIKTNLSCMPFHDLILILNIKRWKKISKTISNEEYNKIIIILTINLEIKKNNINVDIIKCYETNNFDDIIKYCFEFNKSKIFNLLIKNENYDLYKNIRKLYPELIFIDGIKFSKIYKIFYRHYKKCILI